MDKLFDEYEEWTDEGRAFYKEIQESVKFKMRKLHDEKGFSIREIGLVAVSAVNNAVNLIILDKKIERFPYQKLEQHKDKEEK